MTSQLFIPPLRILKKFVFLPSSSLCSLMPLSCMPPKLFVQAPEYQIIISQDVLMYIGGLANYCTNNMCKVTMHWLIMTLSQLLDMTIRDFAGMTPLHCVCSSKAEDVKPLLDVVLSFSQYVVVYSYLIHSVYCLQENKHPKLTAWKS